MLYPECATDACPSVRTSRKKAYQAYGIDAGADRYLLRHETASAAHVCRSCIRLQHEVAANRQTMSVGSERTLDIRWVPVLWSVHRGQTDFGTSG